tara:strand:- start:1206 stop:1481 length:276 start_codon:yes stop_codon:yes gene_type:complete
MEETNDKWIYFLYADTEFYTSETKVVGVYLNHTDAINHANSIRNISSRQEGVCGTYWKQEYAGLRYYIRKFKLGRRQAKGTTHRGLTVTAA